MNNEPLSLVLARGDNCEPQSQQRQVLGELLQQRREHLCVHSTTHTGVSCSAEVKSGDLQRRRLACRP